MDTWLLPKARPISCNDCPAFQRLHTSVLCIAESLTRLTGVINTTFRKKIYIRWCCIDPLSWHRFSGLGRQNVPAWACSRDNSLCRGPEKRTMRVLEIQIGNPE